MLVTTRRTRCGAVALHCSMQLCAAIACTLVIKCTELGLPLSYFVWILQLFSITENKTQTAVAAPKKMIVCTLPYPRNCSAVPGNGYLATAHSKFFGNISIWCTCRTKILSGATHTTIIEETQCTRVRTQPTFLSRHVYCTLVEPQAFC